MTSLRHQRRHQNDFSEDLARKGWYHSFEGIDGAMPLVWLQQRWSRFPLPADLTGKRVLDIGSWDGWFSFEAERRGANVTSVDREEIENYRTMHRRLGSKNDYRILDFYEIPAAGLGRFDVVFCLGVLYHIRHPMLALELLCSITNEVAIIETFTIEGDPEIPIMEFYETNELNGQFDNWIGPTANCVLAMCRAAGFARVEQFARDHINLGVACYRKWQPEPAEPEVEAPELLGVSNAIGYGINFATTRDEYLSCWFRTAVESVTRGDLCLEVGGFGAPAVFVRPPEDGKFLANFRLPPGARQGWNDVRLRLKNSRFGNALRIAVDVPVVVEKIVVAGVCDGVTFRTGEAGETVSCWVEGLPENADLLNVRLSIGDRRLRAVWMGEPEAGLRQINALVPAGCTSGEFVAECGGVRSNGLPLVVKQELPAA
jgi:tRNA (mo5U34)-methyltransferase